MSEPDFEVVWPLGKQVVPSDTSQGEPANDKLDLNKATVGFLWNYTRKGDEMFGIMKERLRDEYPGISFVEFDKFGNIHGANESEVVAALPQLLHDYKVDVTLVGIGG